MTRNRSQHRQGVHLIAVVVGIALILLVGWRVIHRHVADPVPSASCAESGPPTEVSGVIGSEKEAFFSDQRVVERFACAGLAITVDSRGSREMIHALRPGHGYQFAFPSSTPTAEKVKSVTGSSDQFTPFSSPMAIATFRPIAEILRRANVVQLTADGSSVLDITELLKLVRQGTRWDELAGNREYPHNTVLLRTTDPRDSNSAIMFLSIVAHVANGGQVVTRREHLRKVMPELCRLVFDQGTKPETSQVLFEQYLRDGMGRVPMAMIYESQFLTKVPGQKPALTGDHVFIFPRPTVYSRHTLIPFDQNGRKIGRLLRDDRELRRLAEEYGFRAEGRSGVGGRKAPANVVESPSYELLESMLGQLEPTPENAERCAK